MDPHVSTLAATDAYELRRSAGVAKVDETDVPRKRVHKNVLGLHVSMAEAEIVHELQSRNKAAPQKLALL